MGREQQMAAVDLELIIQKYLDAYGGPETTDSTRSYKCFQLKQFVTTAVVPADQLIVNRNFNLMWYLLWLLAHCSDGTHTFFEYELLRNTLEPKLLPLKIGNLQVWANFNLLKIRIVESWLNLELIYWEPQYWLRPSSPSPASFNLEPITKSNNLEPSGHSELEVLNWIEAERAKFISMEAIKGRFEILFFDTKLRRNKNKTALEIIKFVTPSDFLEREKNLERWSSRKFGWNCRWWRHLEPLDHWRPWLCHDL